MFSPKIGFDSYSSTNASFKTDPKTDKVLDRLARDFIRTGDSSPNPSIPKTVYPLLTPLLNSEKIEELARSSLLQDVPLTPWDAFGFHKVHKDDERNIKSFKICSNIANPFGWLPVIGTIVGLVRIILSSIAIHQRNQKLKQDSFDANEKVMIKQEVKLLWTEIARGAFELTSLGSLLFLADIPITIARACGKIN